MGARTKLLQWRSTLEDLDMVLLNLLQNTQSKEKTLAKMREVGLTEKVMRDLRCWPFRFTDVGKLLPPVLQFVDLKFTMLRICMIKNNQVNLMVLQCTRTAPIGEDQLMVFTYCFLQNFLCRPGPFLDCYLMLTCFPPCLGWFWSSTVLLK